MIGAVTNFYKNNLSPYSFLRFVAANIQAKSWLILFSRESDARDFVDQARVLSAMFSWADSGIDFLPDSDIPERSRIFHLLSQKEIKMIAATPSGAFASGPSRQFREGIEEGALRVSAGLTLERAAFLKRLEQLGYKRVDIVESSGEYCVRGQILDCFSPVSSEPLRMLFNNDRLESIRYFDPMTQTSAGFVSEAWILSMVERVEGILGDYLDAPLAVAVENMEIFERAPSWVNKESLIRFGEKTGELLPVVENVPFAGSLQLFWKQAQEFWERGFEIWMAAPTEGDQERAQEVVTESAHAERIAMGPIKWMTGAIGSGSQDSVNKIWLVNTQEIFSRTPVRVSAPAAWKKKTTRRRGQKAFQESLLELKLGDYVVHEIYGISRYRGLERVLDMQGLPHGEFVKLEFAKKDHLFVNPDQMHLIHRYMTLGAKYSPKLSSLDARRFDEIKERVREEARKFAQDLLKLWAKRETLPAERIEAIPKWEEEFSKSFPYEETDDQKRAISEVLGDLEKSRPMERLLHGDVGFGKTEVALRAIFRTVMQGRQAVLVAPTTVLADQHFRNFSNRLSSYPVTVGLFSRFAPKSQIKSHLKMLKEGKLDVAIGTHRLLSRDIHFKNIGLLVIDEEHRFGVSHKERLKMLSSQVHTLAMSATPIPRTLAGALSGLREISTIESPPVGRLAIESSVLPWDWAHILKAVEYELGRGGQVFYVANEISRLPVVAKEFEAAVPGLRAGICHGQMSALTIEKTMDQFLRQEIDVLVASTIIESGLDIATVNTMIVEEAQDFGLAQLYQLRGRIGRNNVKAYAYFYYPKNRRLQELSSAARERLGAIEEFCELGSGMRLALRDLEIRGAGEIIGKKQHGFVTRVGLEMYSKLLKQEIEKVKTGESGAKESLDGVMDQGPSVHLELPAFFPEDLLPSEIERVSYYRRLSRCASEAELAQVFDELKDRCGELPPQALSLNLLFELRLACRKSAIASIDELDDSWIRFEFVPGARPQGSNIAWLIQEFGPRLRFEHTKQAFRIQFSDEVSLADQVLLVLNKLS